MHSPSVAPPPAAVIANSSRGSREASRNSGGAQPATPQAPPSAADGIRKSNKRRRDDDFDINSIKRRAVSPGVSVQNSPILSQSPVQRESAGFWGTPKASRESSIGGHAAGERSNSGGSLPNSTPSLGPK